MSAPADALTEDDPTPPRPITDDAEVLALVGATFAAARILTSTPLVVVLLAVAIGVLTIRPKLVWVAALLFVGWHAGHDLAALEPVATRPLDRAEAVLKSDPVDDGGVVSVQVDIEGDRVLVSARSAQAGVLRTASLGDRVHLTGTIRGVRPTTSWRISRRIVGQVTASEVNMVATAGGPTGAANALRDTIRNGARSLDPDRQVLFTGLVFGDDRGQDPIVADNFRAAGLGHLLAVSGQNVVFVLLLAAPAVGRIRSAPVRVTVSLALLAGFGFLTRFEPSVSRALVMAGLALVAHAVGRPGNASALLPPAVLGLVMFDPLLAWSLAFQLSVLATLGLVILTPRIAARLPGPTMLVLAMSATLGAQAAVSPLLIATFGTVSAVAVPANLLAGPAAAGVMMWGLVAGTVAGLSPPAVAEAIHLSTRVMLWWIAEVAEVFAGWPVGHVRAMHLIVLTAVAVVALALDRVHQPARRPVELLLAFVCIGTVVVVFIAPRPLAIGHHQLLDGVEVVRASSGHVVVVLHGAPRQEDTIAALRRARLGTIDVVIAESGSRDVGRLVRVLSDRFPISEIWAPANHEVPGAITVEPGRCRSDSVACDVLQLADDRDTLGHSRG